MNHELFLFVCSLFIPNAQTFFPELTEVEVCTANDGLIGYQCPMKGGKCVSSGAACRIDDSHNRCTCPGNFCTHPECGNGLIRCNGWKTDQCITDKLLCDGKYDCIDRSDESNCGKLIPKGTTAQINGESEMIIMQNKDSTIKVMRHQNELCRDPQLQIGRVNHLLGFLKKCQTKERSLEGLTFGSNVKCIAYDDMCKNLTIDHNFDCLPLLRLLNSNYFCTNVENFKDKDICSSKGQIPCTGNSPSHCYEPLLQCTIRAKSTETNCPDYSDYICNKKLSEEWELPPQHHDMIIRHNFSMCEKEGHFLCADGMKCIHRNLLCDGYEQCNDGSDEGQEKCSVCPNGGFVIEGLSNSATFSCLHRHTKRPICAIPCNGKDDLCLNFEDESDETCRTQKSHSIFRAAAIFIVLVTIASCVFGEIIYRSELKDATDLHEKEAGVNAKILHFIEEIDKDGQDIGKLESLFDAIHKEGDVETLIFLLDLRFESYKLAHAFQNIYHFELSIHSDNLINAELCLKNALGTNELAARFMDLVEFSFVTEMKLKITDHFSQKCGNSSNSNSQIKPILLNVGLLAMKITVYYYDMFKDVIFILILMQFELYFIVLILSISFIANASFQLGSIHGMRKSQKLTDKVYFFMILTFPLFPAYLLYILSRLNYQKLSIGNAASINHKINEVNRTIAAMKRTESVTENFFQMAINILLIGFILSPTATIFSRDYDTIIDANDTFLYVTAFLSVISITMSTVGQVKASFNGYLPFKGVLSYGLFILVSISARISALLLLVTPSYGLLSTTWHYKKGLIPMSHHHEDANNWKLVDLNDILWGSPPPQGFLLDGFAVLQFFITLWVTWKRKKKQSESIMWCDTISNILENVLMSPYNGRINIIIFTAFNLFLMIPIWVLRYTIARRNEYLEKWFPQLDEELYSTDLVNYLTVIGTLALGLVFPLLQYHLLKIYKEHGQPWPRVINVKKRHGRKYIPELQPLNIYG